MGPAGPVCRVDLLGPASLSRDGVPLPRLRSRTAHLLLGLLVAEPTGLTRDRAAGLLWPRTDTGRARAELSRLGYDLRARLGDVLTADRTRLALVPGGVHSDVHDVLAAVGSGDPATWGAAVAGVRGRFLEDADLSSDRQVDDELLRWVEDRRHRLDRAVATTYERLVTTDLAAGEVARAVDHAQRWVRYDPHSERAHRAVMTTLARAGHPGAALAHLDQVTADLPARGRTHVARATRDLAQDIEDGRGRQAPAPPARTTALVGRRPLLDRLGALLTADEHRVITLTGPLGVGKTRLAVELAHQPGRTVQWVDLTLLRRVEDIRTGADGVPAPGRPTLVVLDGAEHLAGLSRAVDQLVHRFPAATVLVTSRGPLHLIGGPPGVLEVAVPPLTRDAAADLLIARAGDVGVDLGNPDARAAVDAVCHLMDDLPLALELVANQSRLTGVRQLVELAHEVLDLPASREPGRPERHRTLRRAITTAVDLLPADVRAVLRGTEPDASAPAPADVLHALRTAGLVRREPGDGEPRFRLLRPVAALLARG